MAAEQDEGIVIGENYHRMIRLLLAAALALGVLLSWPDLTVQAGDNGWAALGDSRQLQQNARAHALPEEPKVPERNPYNRTQCTYRAWDLAARAGHKLPRFGNAHAWQEKAIEQGYRVSDALSHDAVNSVAVWDSYVGGTFRAGHVAWVTAVSGDKFYVQERNWIGGSDGERWVRWQEGISFITLGDPASEPAGGAVPAPAGEIAAPARPESPGELALALQRLAEESWVRLPAVGGTGLTPGGKLAPEPWRQPSPWDADLAQVAVQPRDGGRS